MERRGLHAALGAELQLLLHALELRRADLEIEMRAARLLRQRAERQALGRRAARAGEQKSE
jgi:hypothetical protein